MVSNTCISSVLLTCLLFQFHLQVIHILNNTVYALNIFEIVRIHRICYATEHCHYVYLLYYVSIRKYVHMHWRDVLSQKQVNQLSKYSKFTHTLVHRRNVCDCINNQELVNPVQNSFFECHICWIGYTIYSSSGSTLI